MRELRGQHPEGLLYDRRRYATDAKLEEEYLSLPVGLNPLRDLPVLLLVELPLQKVAVSPHPGECFPPTVRATGHKVARHLKTISHCPDHFANGPDRVPHLVGAAVAALEETMVSLYLRDLVPRVDL